MAEKSIRIADGTSGLYVAVRDAVQQDSSLNDRVVQLLDFASRKFPTPYGFPKRGNSRTRTYTSGGTHEVLVGDILTGATSAVTARVIAITLTGGTWAGGDAAGTITVCDQSGTFQSENLNEGVNANVCTIAGDSSAATLTAADTLDLTGLPADLLQNLITVGDASVLVVSVEQTVSGGSATIVPILFDNATTPGVYAILQHKVITQTYAFRRGSGSGNYLLPTQLWDCSGAYKIGLNLTAISGTSNALKIYGWVL